MKNLIITMLSLVFSTALLAEPVLYICERPTWGDDEGCGPNKTRYTYAFVIDSEDFSTKKRNGNDSNENTRAYTWAETRGCDLSRSPGKEGQYLVTDKGFMFGMGRRGYGREVEMHTDSMQAKLLGASVKNSPFMTCTEYSGEDIQAPSVPKFYSNYRSTEQVQRPVQPTFNVNSDYQRQ